MANTSAAVHTMKSRAASYAKYILSYIKQTREREKYNEMRLNSSNLKTQAQITNFHPSYTKHTLAQKKKHNQMRHNSINLTAQAQITYLRLFMSKAHLGPLKP